MVKTRYKFIEQKPSYRGGMAHIRNSGVTVAGIIIMLNGNDSLETIVSSYPGLTKRKVEEAIAYYQGNKNEIRRDIYELTQNR